MSYERAFALRDNPFGPTRPLSGIKNPALMQMLESRPLMVDVEPILFELYCLTCGPFEKHISEFKGLIATAGYADRTSIGLSSFIFLILGHKGTGKTSLVHAMVPLETMQGKWPTGLVRLRPMAA